MEQTLRNTCINRTHINIPKNAQNRPISTNCRSAAKKRLAMPKTTVPMRALRQQKIPCRK